MNEETRRRIARISKKVLAGGEASEAELIFLSRLAGEAVYELLYWANRIRTKFHGRKVKFCSIVSAKQGRCPEDCKFCSQSVHHRTAIKTFPLIPTDEVVKAARQATEVGAESFGIVISGRRASERDWGRIVEMVKGVSRNTKLRPCASLGALTLERARELKKAGLVRYHHNLETSRRFFPRLCTTHTYEERVTTALAAKRAGLELCCGGIFGVGESRADRVSLALTLREIDPDSVPLNFLNPIRGTPLENSRPMAPMEILKTIALFRFALPRKEIKVCGGREVNLRDLQSWIYYAGATGAIIGNYLTTSGRPAAEDIQMIRDLGLRLC